MAMLGYEEAARWYETALAAGREPNADLLVALGEARDAAGERPAARQAFLEAAAAARRSGRADLLAAAALGMSGAIGFEISLLDREQIDLLREALAVLPAEAAAPRAAVMARLSVAVSYLEGADERMRLTEAALELARRSGDHFALVQALAARCDALAGPDHCAVRTEMAAEIVALGTEMAEPPLELLGRRMLLVALLEQGRLAEADREIRRFAATTAAVRRPLFGWYVPLWRGMRALMEGRTGDAESAFDDAEEQGSQAGSANAPVLVGGARWVLLAEQDRRDEIEALASSVPFEAMPGVWPLVSLALVTAQVGRLDQARAFLDTAVPRLPEAEVDSEWLPMMTQLAETILLVGGHSVAAWTYERLVPYRRLFVVEGIGAAVRGSVERYLGILAASLGRQAEAAAHFEAAVNADAALGATLLVARDLHDAGISLDDRQRLRDARERYAALGISRRVAAIDARLGGGGDVGADRADASVFRREGEVWRIAYAGREVQLRDSKGLRDLARLLAQPGRPVPAVELAAGGGPVVPQGDLGEVVDRRAREAYRRRLAELEEEIDEADRAADPFRSSRASTEKEALVAQLTAAYGLGRRPRRAGDPAERARQTVSARVRDAMERIESAHPDLGRHLRRSLRTGRVCVYEPDSTSDWMTE
jgi:tetratricopeptide (TPR) repeat protein